MHASLAPGPFLDACLNFEDWPVVSSQTTTLGVGDSTLDLAGDTDLASCFGAMNARDISLTLETGVLGFVSSGTTAFNINRDYWDRFIQLGANLTALYMQEPKTTAELNSLGLTYSQIVDETVDWIQLVRANYAGMRLVLQEAFPHNSSSELIDFIADLKTECAARSLQCIDAFELDHDLNAGGWSWGDVADVRDGVHGESLPLSVIFWPSGLGSGDECDAYSIMLAMGNGYRTFDIVPDEFTIQSWDTEPDTTLPEGWGLAGGCTFMNIAFTFIHLYDDFFTLRHTTMSLRASSDHYVVAEDGGNDVVNADRTAIGPWETFDLMDLNGGDLEDGDPVALRTYEGWYVSAEDGGGSGKAVLGTGWAPEAYETFILHGLTHPSGVVQNGDEVGLQSANGYYVVAEDGGGGVVNVDRSSLGAWETFRIILH